MQEIHPLFGCHSFSFYSFALLYFLVNEKGEEQDTLNSACCPSIETIVQRKSLCLCTQFLLIKNKDAQEKQRYSYEYFYAQLFMHIQGVVVLTCQRQLQTTLSQIADMTVTKQSSQFVPTKTFVIPYQHRYKNSSFPYMYMPQTFPKGRDFSFAARLIGLPFIRAYII